MSESLLNNESESKDGTSNLLATLNENVFFPQLGLLLENVIKVDRLVIYLVREDSSVQLISRDGAYVENGPTLEKGKGPAGHVIRTRSPYFSNNVERDPLFSNFTQEGLKAELVFPIAHEGIVIATAHFQCFDCVEEFSNEDFLQVKKLLTKIKQPLANMKMYLSAKHLNESLIKQVEIKEKELQRKESGINISDSYRIEEKEIIGKSPAMREILRLADKIAATDVNALIYGERGVGKEMVSRRVHCRSGRQERAFISIDCSAFDEMVLEKEIFGQEFGNFKEINVKNGLLEMAKGGTLFLNNVDRLTINLQSKLQRFIQEGLAFRVGGHMPYRSNVRLMAAATADLVEMVKEGTFREDLLYTINTMVLTVPSLRERKEDVVELASYFLNLNRLREDQKSFSPGVIKSLNEYKWPGNVRELQNVIERAYILSDGVIVEKNHLADFVMEAQAEEIVEDEQNIPFHEMTLDELEKRHICQTLEHLGGNKTKTAKTLGITVKTLYNKLHSYGMIQPKEA
jgi:Nif-specific regulatory protein